MLQNAAEHYSESSAFDLLVDLHSATSGGVARVLGRLGHMDMDMLHTGRVVTEMLRSVLCILGRRWLPWLYQRCKGRPSGMAHAQPGCSYAVVSHFRSQRVIEADGSVLPAGHSSRHSGSFAKANTTHRPLQLHRPFDQASQRSPDVTTCHSLPSCFPSGAMACTEEICTTWPFCLSGSMKCQHIILANDRHMI